MSSFERFLKALQAQHKLKNHVFKMREGPADGKYSEQSRFSDLFEGPAGVLLLLLLLLFF